MIDPYGVNRLLNWADPLDRTHPLNVGRLAWWLAHPFGMGGPVWRDLIGISGGAITAATWGSTRRPGGFGELLCNGSTSQIDVPQGVIPIGAAVRTWSAWFRCSTAPLKVVLDCGPNTSTARFLIYDSGTGVMNTYNGTFVLPGSKTITDNVWHQVVSTWDGTNLRQYMDGLPDATPTGVTVNTGTGVRIGRALDNGGPFPGPLDGISLWGRALSATEVLALYQEERAGYPGTLSRIGPSAFLMRTAAAGGVTGSASLASVASLAASGSLTYAGASALASSDTLSGLGGAAYAGAGALASSDTFGAAGSLAYAGAGALGCVSTLGGTGGVAYAEASALASVATLAGAGSYSPPIGSLAANLGSVATLGATGRVTYAGASSLATVCTLAGAGSYVPPAGSLAANLASSDTLGATGSYAVAGGGGAASLANVCTLAGVGSYAAGSLGDRCVLRGTGHYVPGAAATLIFEEALAQCLVANPVIVSVAGARVYPGMIPQKSALPCVTFEIPSKPRVPDLDGPARLARARVNISCWAHKYGDCKTLARGVVAGLPIGFTGLLGNGVRITDTYHLNEIDLYEQPDNASDVGTYRVLFEMRMDYREAF